MSNDTQGGAKKCRKCNEVKPTDAFGSDRKRGRAYLKSRCRSCLAGQFRDYRASNPEAAARHAERDKRDAPLRAFRLRSESLETATKHFQEWTGPELELVQRDDLSIMEMARMLGRTYSSVVMARANSRRDPRKQALAGIERGEL